MQKKKGLIGQMKMSSPDDANVRSGEGGGERELDEERILGELDTGNPNGRYLCDGEEHRMSRAQLQQNPKYVAYQTTRVPGGKGKLRERERERGTKEVTLSEGWLTDEEESESVQSKETLHLRKRGGIMSDLKSPRISTVDRKASPMGCIRKRDGGKL